MVLSYEFFYIHIKKTQFILHLLEKKNFKDVFTFNENIQGKSDRLK